MKVYAVKKIWEAFESRKEKYMSDAIIFYSDEGMRLHPFFREKGKWIKLEVKEAE